MVNIKVNQSQSLSEPKYSDKYPFYVSKDVVKQLLKGKEKVMRGNQDRLYVIDGRERSGKSTLGRQLAYVLDPTINLARVVFTADQFEKAIKGANKGQAIIFDEAFRGLSSKSSISKENKRLVQLLMECGQKNLFIFIILPSFFLLEKYVAIFRSHALFTVMMSKANYMRRGYKIFNYETKRKLYILGKNMMDYSRPKIRIYHRFYGKIVPTINEKEYDRKKLKSFQAEVKEVKEESNIIKQRNFLMYLLNKEKGLTAVEIAEKLKGSDISLSSSVISRCIKATVSKMTNDK